MGAVTPRRAKWWRLVILVIAAPGARDVWASRTPKRLMHLTTVPPIAAWAWSRQRLLKEGVLAWEQVIASRASWTGQAMVGRATAEIAQTDAAPLAFANCDVGIAAAKAGVRHVRFFEIRGRRKGRTTNLNIATMLVISSIMKFNRIGSSIVVKSACLCHVGDRQDTVMHAMVE